MEHRRRDPGMQSLRSAHELGDGSQPNHRLLWRCTDKPAGYGPGLVVGVGNGLMLGYLMYRSGLVPPRMAILGLVGGPMLIISFVLILFGAESDRRAQGGDGIAQPQERIDSFTSDR